MLISCVVDRYSMTRSLMILRFRCLFSCWKRITNTNYRQRSGKAIINSMVYFDPETARDSVDGGRCWGERF